MTRSNYVRGASLFVVCALSASCCGVVSLPSNRGQTVANLGVVVKALKDHEKRTGEFPASLEELPLARAQLVDGIGNTFLYARPDRESAELQTVVAMSEPTGHHFLDFEKGWHFVVRDPDGTLRIRSADAAARKRAEEMERKYGTRISPPPLPQRRPDSAPDSERTRTS